MLFKVKPGSIAVLQSKQLIGDIRLEMKFGNQLPANVTLNVLSEEPAMLEIAQLNNVVQ